jgi:hypothetical protein
VEYIKINRWDDFQHYKDREPVWIKNYTKLLEDDNYRGLTGVQRAALHGLWLLYAKRTRNVPHNTSLISSELGFRVTKRTLEALSHAGFITVSASKPASKSASASLLKALEKAEKDNPVPAPAPVPEVRPLGAANGAGAGAGDLPKWSTDEDLLTLVQGARRG